MKSRIIPILFALSGMAVLLRPVVAIADGAVYGIGKQPGMSAQQRQAAQQQAAKQAAREAAFNAEVDREAASMGGAHRKNEARKLVEMRQKAAAARSRGHIQIDDGSERRSEAAEKKKRNEADQREYAEYAAKKEEAARQERIEAQQAAAKAPYQMKLGGTPPKNARPAPGGNRVSRQ